MDRFAHLSLYLAAVLPFSSTSDISECDEQFTQVGCDTHHQRSGGINAIRSCLKPEVKTNV